ncbi:ribonuclease H-like domain-containing protein [Helicostylum pulchrum]|nr:ribonuclease H-like domain-containing protein [Helicostylum pulchrum]
MNPPTAHVVSYNDITNDNVLSYFPEIINRVNAASHIAIDLEFTALGNTRSADMGHRYVAMKQTVESAAIVSIGLSIIKPVESTEPITTPVKKYECDNFNFLTLKQGSIVIDSNTGTFLCHHGYSFDSMFTKGIPFTPASPASPVPPRHPLPNEQKPDAKLNQLWKHIIDIMRFKRIPLVLHNGLFDLMYIYHSFIGQLPPHFNTFILKTSLQFPSGIYDTRYLAEKADFKATFLKYVFSKTDRLRQNRAEISTDQRPYFEVTVNLPILQQNSVSGLKRKRQDDIVNNKDVVDNKIQKLGYCPKYAVRENYNTNIIIHTKKKKKKCQLFVFYIYIYM